MKHVFFLLPWLVMLTGALWLTLEHIPPSGVKRVAVVLDGREPWVYPFLPAARVTPPGRQADGWIGQAVLDDPVYGGIRIPGPFDEAYMAFEARLKRQPWLEIGVSFDQPKSRSTVFYPAWSQALAQGWQAAPELGQDVWIRATSSSTDLRAIPLDHQLSWRSATSTAPKLTDALPLDLPGINLVKTPYRQPDILSGGWLRIHIHLQIPNAARVIKLTLSAPHLKERNGEVDIRSIEVTFQRRPKNAREWRRIIESLF